MNQKIRLILNVLLVVILLAACEQKAASPTSEPPIVTESPVAPTEAGTATPFVMPTDETTDPDCNILWSRLRIGDQAVLTYGDRPNRVRSEPVKDPTNVIAQIYPGTVVSVVDGPVCTDGMMYWKVEHASIPGGSGWTSEGDGNQKHWLGPAACGGSLYRYHYAIVMPGVRGLRVYDQQGSDGQEIAQVSADTILKVVDLPYCTGTSPNLVYWKVENDAIPGGSGWVAEYGYENDEYVQYLRYFWEADPLAFPQPPTLATIAPKWPTVASLDLAELENPGQIAYVTDDWAWVINTDGTDAYELRNPLGSYDTPHYLSWSPDGNWVTMVIGKKIFMLSVNEIDGGLQAEEIEYPAIPPEYYANDYITDVVWSFDGEYVAFMAGFTIYAMNADGTDLHVVNTDHDFCASPTWSPYGTYLAYICYEYGASIYVSRVDMPGTTTYEAMGNQVVWSPDGVYLAYDDFEDGLSIVEAATGAKARTLVPEGSDTFAWSPDSQSIAFTYSDQIFLVNIEDGSISNLTGHTVEVPFDRADGALSWSPDGKYIVFEFQTYAFDNGYWKANPIYILDVATGARAQLVDQGTLPVWSPVITYPIVQLPDCTAGWSRLKAGEPAILLGDPDTDPPNRVRAEASQSALQVGKLYAGTVVDVLEGPVCSDGLVYWKVRGTIYPADINSTIVPPDIGWTAEGDGTTYWLAPYQP